MKKVLLSVTGFTVLAGALYFLSPDGSDAETPVASDSTIVTIDPIHALLREDSAVTIAIAAYPDTVRTAVLTVCEYPDAILRVEELQQNTQTAFRTLTHSLSTDKQTGIWNITRYPGLTEKLGGEKPLSKSELDTLATKYPEDVRVDIIESGIENYTLLCELSALNKSTAASFDSLVSDYPVSVQNEIRTVIRHPELLELLGENMRFTVKAGDLHKTDPVRLNQQLDSLNTELAVQKTREIKDWKEGLEKNPVAKAEFDSATSEYKTEHNARNETTIVNETVIVNYVCYPYSYWYGYPSWYNYPYWYPYPYWYQCGYYYGPHGIVYFGCPTPYYTWWYFYHYPHHYHYCYFSDYYIDYYYGHRHVYSPTGRVVEGWVAQEQPRVSRTFFKKNASRPERIKELGRAEVDRAEFNKKNPTGTVTRDEYVRNNPDKYPDLVPGPVQGNTAPGKVTTPQPPTPKGTTGPTTKPPQQPPAQKPTVRPPSTSPAPAPPRPVPAPVPNPKPPVQKGKPK